MSGVSKLGFALILAFIFSLLGFSAELLYVLWYRRKSRRDPPAGDDPELSAGGEEDPFGSFYSKYLLLHFLCCGNHSRVEPAAATSSLAAVAKPLPPPAEECELARWRATCFGPSRVLYTIREEEEFEGEKGVEGIFGGSDMAAEEEETPFATPCPSPPFYTPVSSPPRAVEKIAGGLSLAAEIV